MYSNKNEMPGTSYQGIGICFNDVIMRHKAKMHRTEGMQ